MSNDINIILNKLKKSKFRSSFYLKKDLIIYIDKVGFEKIKKHAIDFINQKLAPSNPLNDGKQTPMKNHPVFVAMHATACCCRSCLKKWHHIEKGKELSNDEKNYIYKILITWILKEYNLRKNNDKILSKR